jgi:hypothetical protein
MHIIKSLTILIFICPLIINAQITFLPEGSKENQFIDRLEIKADYNTNINFSAVKPYSRKAIVEEVNTLIVQTLPLLIHYPDLLCKTHG